VTFEKEETVDKVVEIHYHDINNKTVHSASKIAVQIIAGT